MGVFVGWLSKVHTSTPTWEIILKYGRLRLCRITSKRSKSCLTKSMVFPTSVEFPDIRSTAAASLPLRFTNALNKACGEIYPKTNKIIWFNMRQEPIVYVNGNPVCARPPNKIGEYAELGDVTRESVKKDEEEFIRVLEGRAKGAEGKIKVIDVNKKESEIEVKDLITLSKVMEGLKEKFPGLVHMRIPVCNSAAPTEVDLDNLCKTLQGSAVNTPVIVNCQVGLSRSTTGCVAACLFREFQLAASYECLVETVPGVNLDLLKMDRYKMDMSKIPSSEVSLRSSRSSALSFPMVRLPRENVTKLLTKMVPPRPVALVSSS